MSSNPLDLRSFRLRVRLVRAWRGLAVGLVAGGLLGAVWAVLDVTGVWFTEWAWLGALFGGLGLVCALVGALLPVSDEAIARSVDRRAGLRDRLGTFIERKESHDSFDEALRHDTEEHVGALRAKRVFPVRMGRWQYVGVSAVVLASLVFLLGNTWYVLSPEAKKAKEELEKIGAQIERVAKPILEDKNATEEEKSFANELDAFARRLEKGRITKEEAMKRANELAKQAEKLTRDRMEMALEKTQTVREQMMRSKLGEKGLDKASLDKMNLNNQQRRLLEQLQQQAGMDPKAGDQKFDQDAMERLGLQDMDPTLLNLTDEQRDLLREMIEKELQAVQEQLANAQEMDQETFDKLMAQQQELQEMREQLEISEEMRKAIEEFMNSPEFKDIMEAVGKMREAARQVMDGQPLTDEQIQDLEQMIEELDEKLQDSQYREMVIGELKEALEALKKGELVCKAGGT